MNLRLRDPRLHSRRNAEREKERKRERENERRGKWRIAHPTPPPFSLSPRLRRPSMASYRPSLLPEIGPDGLARDSPVIAYTEKVIEEGQLQLKKYIQENYSKIRDVERELENLSLEMKLTAGPKKQALEHLRKKIELGTERIRMAKLKEEQTKRKAVKREHQFVASQEIPNEKHTLQAMRWGSGAGVGTEEWYQIEQLEASCLRMEKHQFGVRRPHHDLVEEGKGRYIRGWNFGLGCPC